jgi:hypothetical protein
MKHYIIFLSAILLLTAIAGGLARADGKEDPLPKVGASYIDAVNSGDCKNYWDALWPAAKSGDLKARERLFFLLAVRMHSDVIYPPGRTGDYITHLRDITVFAVHSIGVAHETQTNRQALIETSEAYFSQAGFGAFQRGREFLICVETKADDSCARLAVQNKLVPSFEEYANELDAIAATGKKSICVPASENVQP